MENAIKKCSFKSHKEIDAIIYCEECKIYMCKKCGEYHEGLFENHHQYNFKNTPDTDIFINICQEPNHPNKLEYYCKNHNILCCASCITKIKGLGNGQHKDCDICFITDIKDEKQKLLKNNLKILEDFSNSIEKLIEELKIMFEKVNENKEELKIKISKNFTKIREILNNREDELLKEVENIFNNTYCSEEFLQKCEKIPNQINKSIKKGKILDQNWNENKLNSLIYECINIENSIKDINIINEKIKNYKLKKNLKIQFSHLEEGMDYLIKDIQKYGGIFLLDLDSLILKNKDDFDKFHNLVLSREKIKNIRLIYRSTKDGFNYLSIVNKINNKSNLLFLYLTGNNRIFGAFIKTKLDNIDLNGSIKYYKDENAFAFSLNNNKIYKILVPGNSIAFDSTYFILVGNSRYGNGFYYYQNVIYDQSLINGAKIYEFSKNSELTEGNGKLNELEIFEINYD